MSKDFSNIEQELARLKERAPSPNYLSRKRELYNKQVGDFASRLEPDVKKALDQEASSDIAEEWLDEATQMLKSIIPELPPGLEQRQEFKDAAARVRKGLTEQFLKDALKPSADEIGSHTRELAQCVLANWFSILEHAKHDHTGETQELSANAMPKGVDHKAVYEGVKAFAVPVEIVASKFTNYVDSLVQKGPVVELAPDLYLVQKGQQKYLANSEKVALDLAAIQSKDKSRDQVGPRVLDLFAPVDEFLAPCLRSSPGLFWRTRKRAISMSWMDEKMEQQLAKFVAYQATQESSSNLIEIEPADPTTSHAARGELNDSRGNISADLADYVVLELGQALDGGIIENFKCRVRVLRAMEKCLAGVAKSFTSEGAIDCMYRVSVAGTGYAVSGVTSKSQPVAFDAAAVKECIERNPEVGEVVSISVQAAKHVLAMPQAQTIATEMKRRIPDLLA